MCTAKRGILERVGIRKTAQKGSEDESNEEGFELDNLSLERPAKVKGKGKARDDEELATHPTMFGGSGPAGPSRSGYLGPFNFEKGTYGSGALLSDSGFDASNPGSSSRPINPFKKTVTFADDADDANDLPKPLPSARIPRKEPNFSF